MWLPEKLSLQMWLTFVTYVIFLLDGKLSGNGLAFQSAFPWPKVESFTFAIVWFNPNLTIVWSSLSNKFQCHRKDPGEGFRLMGSWAFKWSVGGCPCICENSKMQNCVCVCVWIPRRRSFLTFFRLSKGSLTNTCIVQLQGTTIPTELNGDWCLPLRVGNVVVLPWSQTV